METVRSTMKVSCCSTFCHSFSKVVLFFFLIFCKVVLCDRNETNNLFGLFSIVRLEVVHLHILNQFLIIESVFIPYTCIECSTHPF